MHVGDASCLLCHHRPRDEGGKGDCPIKGYPMYRENRIASERGREISCTNFSLGDRRTATKHDPVALANLAAQAPLF